jgi:hypothetical protein
LRWGGVAEDRYCWAGRTEGGGGIRTQRRAASPSKVETVKGL